jgi:putative lipoic acid-binding regulatory protein
VSGGDGNGDGERDILDEELLKFPCRYEIKAMGRESVRFEALVHGIVTGHIGRDHLLATARKLSRNGNYLSVTCIIWATSRDQVEMIYAALKDCPDVLMTL